MNIRRMRGVYVVEFAIIGLLLFVVLFGVLEMGRLYFTVNTLNEVVRRGARLAAVCNIDEQVILERAVFDLEGSDGSSELVGGLATSQVTLTYLDENGAQVGNPADETGADGFRAIRYVHLEVQGFTFDLMIPTLGQTITLPAFRATLPRESLGRSVEGDTEC